MKCINTAPELKGKRVFIRIDFDVPLENGKITNPYRIDTALPTVKYVIEQGGFPILATKLGRPDGKHVEALSTKHLEPYLNARLPANPYTLLENLRFDPREDASDITLAQELAAQADIYVNECFATSHRKDSSIYLLPKLLPAYAGLHLWKEVEVLSKVLSNPQKPLVAIIGGAKLETKKPMIQRFLDLDAHVLVGGKLGLDWTQDVPENLHLPIDYARDNLDIGPTTITKYTDLIQQARTVIWAGPLGKFEEPEFATGTIFMAKAVVASNAYCIAGGGDTISALELAGVLREFDFISTGGGAMLEFLAKGNLPGLEVLEYYG